jgi:hypothetical protein
MRGQISPDMMRAFHFERQIMDALVVRRVITEEAKRLGLDVSEAEIEQKILENSIFRENEPSSAPIDIRRFWRRTT